MEYITDYNDKIVWKLVSTKTLKRIKIGFFKFGVL